MALSELEIKHGLLQVHNMGLMYFHLVICVIVLACCYTRRHWPSWEVEHGLLQLKHLFLSVLIYSLLLSWRRFGGVLLFQVATEPEFKHTLLQVRASLVRDVLGRDRCFVPMDVCWGGAAPTWRRGSVLGSAQPHAAVSLFVRFV